MNEQRCSIIAEEIHQMARKLTDVADERAPSSCDEG